MECQISSVEQVIELKETNDREFTNRLNRFEKELIVIKV